MIEKRRLKNFHPNNFKSCAVKKNGIINSINIINYVISGILNDQ